MNFDLDNLKTLEDFQKLIDDMKYESPTDFKKDSEVIYNLACKFGYSQKLHYSNRKINYYHFSEKDIQDIIDNDINVNRPYDLKRHHPVEYRYSQYRGWLKNLKYNARKPNFSYYDSADKIQELIDKEDIRTPVELNKKIFRYI